MRIITRRMMWVVFAVSVKIAASPTVPAGSRAARVGSSISIRTAKGNACMLTGDAALPLTCSCPGLLACKSATT